MSPVHGPQEQGADACVASGLGTIMKTGCSRSEACGDDESSDGSGSLSGASSKNSRGSGFLSGGVGPCRLEVMEEPTCDMLFPAGDKAESNCHQNPDGEGFMHRVERRLVPAFPARYPGEK